MINNVAYHSKEYPAIRRALALAGLATAALLLAPGSAATATTTATEAEIPAVAGFVASATGYAHPVSWPPGRPDRSATTLEAFVQSSISLPFS